MNNDSEKVDQILKDFFLYQSFKDCNVILSCADSYTYERRAVKQEADFHSLIATEAKTNIAV